MNGPDIKRMNGSVTQPDRLLPDPATRLAEETPVSITVNGIAHAVMMLTPSELTCFALGFAYSEGIISSTEQLRDLTITPEQRALGGSNTPVTTFEINLELSPRQLQHYKKNQRFRRGLTGCGLCGSAALEDALPDLQPLADAPAPKPEHMQGLHTLLAAEQRLANATGGVHGALLRAPDGRVLSCQEDIGRHNALDKVIGYALQQRIDLHSHSVLMSSRCSVELIQKAVRAGLSTLIHLSSPSQLAVKMSRSYNLQLIHYSRRGTTTQYSDPSTCSHQMTPAQSDQDSSYEDSPYDK